MKMIRNGLVVFTHFILKQSELEKEKRDVKAGSHKEVSFSL